MPKPDPPIPSLRNARPTGRRVGRHASRAVAGISILEVVLAVVILAMTVATIASTVSAISMQEQRARQLLACAELANRLVIMYLDDETNMPNEALAIPYGRHEFRYRMNVTRVNSSVNETIAQAIEENQTSQSAQSTDRLKKVAVTVWLGEQSGGQAYPDQGAPQQTIVRVVDPLAFHRRPPESIRILMEQGPERLVDRLMGNDIEAEEE